MKDTVQMEIGGRTLSIETGRLAKQAHGSCLVRFGDTAVLCNVVVCRLARAAGSPCWQFRGVALLRRFGRSHLPRRKNGSRA